MNSTNNPKCKWYNEGGKWLIAKNQSLSNIEPTIQPTVQKPTAIAAYIAGIKPTL